MNRYKKIRLSKSEVRDEHRVIMERHLSRRLSFNEVVHHKNGDKRDNRLENLEVMSRSEHMDEHRADIGKRTWTREDREEYSRKFSGDKHPQSKITKEIGLEIQRRLRAGEKQRILAVEFGISETVVSHINTGIHWTVGGKRIRKR